MDNFFSFLRFFLSFTLAFSFSHSSPLFLSSSPFPTNQTQGVPRLRHVRLTGNPLAASPSYVQACFALLPTLATVDGLDSRGQPAPGAAESLAQSHGRWGDSHSDSNGRGSRRAEQAIEGGGLGHDLSTPHLDEVSQWCWVMRCVFFLSPPFSNLIFHFTPRLIHSTGDCETPGALEWSTRRNDASSRFDRRRSNRHELLTAQKITMGQTVTACSTAYPRSTAAYLLSKRALPPTQPRTPKRTLLESRAQVTLLG